MKWEEWIDVPTIKALTQHASATIVALALFAVVRFVVTLVPLLPATRTIIEVTDEVVLVGLFVWLIVQMALLLWKGRIKNAAASFVLVA
jgi:hypothetical protein